MTVEQFIKQYSAAGNSSCSSTNTSELLKRFKKVLDEDVLTLGNDTLMALEFNCTWETIQDFVNNKNQNR